MKALTPIILIIAAVGLFFVYTDKTYQDIKTIKIQKSQYDQILLKASELQARREALAGQYEQISVRDKERMKKFLPETIDNVRLIIDVEQIARRRNISVQTVSLNSSLNESNSKSGKPSNGGGAIGAPADKYGSVEISFSFTTTYDNFLSFLGDIEESLRLMDVTGFSLKSGQGGLYSFDMTIKTYWLR